MSASQIDAFQRYLMVQMQSGLSAHPVVEGLSIPDARVVRYSGDHGHIDVTMSCNLLDVGLSGPVS